LNLRIRLPVYIVGWGWRYLPAGRWHRRIVPLPAALWLLKWGRTRPRCVIHLLVISKAKLTTPSIKANKHPAQDPIWLITNYELRITNYLSTLVILNS
jgi:hypothetical protein